jgi:broad specificity phosphatase PhoE
MEFYIFRHGDTVETDKFWLRFFGHKNKDSHNVDIVPKAVPALQKIGEYLKNIPIDASFSSPYPRCIHSSEIVTTTSGNIFKTDDKLREFEKNGETPKQLGLRIRNFLKEVETKKYSTIAICTHGAVIGALKHIITTDKFFFFNIWDYPQPGNLIIIKDKKISQINFNP